jgi:hypothetical protein
MALDLLVMAEIYCQQEQESKSKFHLRGGDIGPHYSRERQIPVVEDSKTQSEGLDGIDDEVKDSNTELGTCHRLFFCAHISHRRQRSNWFWQFIDGDRLRHAKPAAGTYQEKEEDDIPEDA